MIEERSAHGRKLWRARDDFWQVEGFAELTCSLEDAETIAARTEQLGPAIGADGARLLQWCSAFAAMTALEMAEAPGGSRAQVEHFIALASRV